jgi:deoxyadenosine kinase
MLRDSGNMEERDYQTYVSLFSHMSNFMKKPNIIVHLGKRLPYSARIGSVDTGLLFSAMESDVSPEQSMERIKSRARGVETGISIEYLRGLHAAYEVHLFQ